MPDSERSVFGEQADELVADLLNEGQTMGWSTFTHANGTKDYCVVLVCLEPEKTRKLIDFAESLGESKEAG